MSAPSDRDQRAVLQPLAAAGRGREGARDVALAGACVTGRDGVQREKARELVREIHEAVVSRVSEYDDRIMEPILVRALQAAWDAGLAAGKAEEQIRLHKLLQWAWACISPDHFPELEAAIAAELMQCDKDDCGRARAQSEVGGTGEEKA